MLVKLVQASTGVLIFQHAGHNPLRYIEHQRRFWRLSSTVIRRYDTPIRNATFC